MSQKNQVFEAETVNNKPAPMQQSIEAKRVVVGAYPSRVKPAQFAFPREVVLRLIDWIKHI